MTIKLSDGKVSRVKFGAVTYGRKGAPTSPAPTADASSTGHDTVTGSGAGEDLDNLDVMLEHTVEPGVAGRTSAPADPTSAEEAADSVEPGERGAAELVRTLNWALSTAWRVRDIGRRLNLDEDSTLAALSALSEATPAQADDPVGSLSAHEEAVLRRAGSLRESMPPLSERASTRTALAAIQLLENALTVQETALRLGVTDSRVRQRLTARSLLGVEDSRGWRVPAFQFDGHALLRGLEVVLPAFPRDTHPLTIRRVLDTPHPDLELEGESVSPREWLRLGGPAEPVAELVAGAFVMP